VLVISHTETTMSHGLNVTESSQVIGQIRGKNNVLKERESSLVVLHMHVTHDVSRYTLP
jgi:hypothetical protein